eukprot:GFKZ01014080.1.p1 GENE.GFKZ01014080.1~~GFKZ01014080.1.p1  ORF type:complete len:145 (-),score=9.92 GFKZ01014080.1:267-701(-)
MTTFFTPPTAPFRPVSLLLIFLSIIPLLTGLRQFLNPPPTSLPVSSPADPLLISQLRFLAAMWLAHVPYLWLIASNPHKYRLFLHHLTLFALIGALGRLWTAFWLGFPLGFWGIVVRAAIVVEIAAGIAVQVMMRCALKRSQKV